MSDYTNIVHVEARLAAETQKKGLKDTITAYLNDIAAQRPDGKLPNGMSVECAAESIIRTAEGYVNTRYAQQATGTALTADEVRGKIAENLKDMTMEQAVAYLSHLQLVYKHFAPDALTGVTAEDLKMEYEQILGNAEGKSLQQQVDELVEALDVEQTNRFLNAVDDELVQQEAVEGTIEKIQAEYATCESAAIRGAAIYGEAVQGNIEGIAPSVDPGTVTAEAAAYTDAAAVATKLENDEITEEEAEKQLGWIGTALAVAMALAWMALLIYGGYELAIIAGQFALKHGAEKTFASVIAGIVFFVCDYTALGEFEKQYPVMCHAVVKMKKAWNKHIGSRLPKLQIRRKAGQNPEFA